MANYANTDIFISDPVALTKLAENLKGESLEITLDVEAGHLSVDTKWYPPTDIIVDLCTEMQVEAKVVYSELGCLGLGLMRIRLVDGVISASTHTFDIPTISAELIDIKNIDSDLYAHVAWMEEDL